MKVLFSLLLFLLLLGYLNAQVSVQDTIQVLQDSSGINEEKADPILKAPTPWSIYLEVLPEIAPRPDAYSIHYQFAAGASYRRLGLGTFINFQRKNIQRTLIFPNRFNLIYLHGGAFLSARFIDYQRIALDLRYNYSLGSMVWENSESKKDLARDNFSLSKPELILQYHILKFVSVFTAAGYKISHGIDLPGVQKNDFNGISFGVGLRVGYFQLAE